MRVQKASGSTGTRAATAFCSTEADGRRRGLVPLVEASEGGSGVGRRALPLPGSRISERSNARYDPITFHAAGLTAAGSPRGKPFIWVKRVLSTAHAIGI